MLGLAKRVGARFLLTSTSEVYGDPLEHPQKESYWGHVNPIGDNCVSRSKLCDMQSYIFFRAWPIENGHSTALFICVTLCGNA